MANVAKLRERARALEQREQWKEALDVYQQVVEESTGDDVDTGLWNRIGDLHLRVGQTEKAVEAYDRAVDAYAEAGLHNNAIALCRKILRIAPGRTSVYLKLGQISAAQGFVADARQNFLEYAQRMQRAGQIDDSFRALKEIADLSPEDTDLRLLLAEQLRSHGREQEALEQLRALLGYFRREGRAGEAEDVARRILALDPGADLSAIPDPDPEPTAPADPEYAGEIDGLELALPVLPADDPLPPPPAGLDAPPQEEAPPEIPFIEGLETSEDYAALAGDGGAADLPLIDPGFDASFELEPAPGPAGSGEEPEDDEEDAEPLPLLDFGGFDDLPPTPSRDPVEALRERVAADPADTAALRELAERLDGRGERAAAEAALDQAHRDLAARGLFREAVPVVRTLLERRPADVVLFQKQVEYAFRAGDTQPLVRAYLDLARHLGPPDTNSKSRAVYQRVLELDPGNPEATRVLAPPPPPPREERAAPAGGYVDLGALILEDDEPGEASTRFVVPEEEPTGDEDRDFADMLAVFRQKVSENIAAEDSSSHYDLGLAFMEMGLVDEAIAEFQVALRGGANPLATLEVLGHCFVEKGQFGVATRVLDRALHLPAASESDLIGVHYQLGRAHEALGNPGAAREQYERVVELDIRFRDAALRLEAVRSAARSAAF